MDDCLFCKIAAGDVPSNKVYEDEYVYSFLDIDPKAPLMSLMIITLKLSARFLLQSQKLQRKRALIKQGIE